MGSEMCIRDRLLAEVTLFLPTGGAEAGEGMRSSDARGGVERGRSRARAKVDANARRPNELDADAETAEATRLLLRCAKREEDSHSSPSASTPHPTTTSPASSAPAASRSSGASLLFLGTGSAEPSKYRGASGVLATLPRSGGNAVAPLLSDDGGYLVDSFEKSAAPSVCLLYTSPSPRDLSTSRMPSSA